jgi:hypothetical protein
VLFACRSLAQKSCFTEAVYFFDLASDTAIAMERMTTLAKMIKFIYNILSVSEEESPYV